MNKMDTTSKFKTFKVTKALQYIEFVVWLLIWTFFKENSHAFGSDCRLNCNLCVNKQLNAQGKLDIVESAKLNWQLNEIQMGIASCKIQIIQRAH